MYSFSGVIAMDMVTLATKTDSVVFVFTTHGLATRVKETVKMNRYLFYHTTTVIYRGRPGTLEPTLDFAEKHSFLLSSPNYGRANLNSEQKPTPI